MRRVLMAMFLALSAVALAAHQPRLVMKEKLTESHPKKIEAPEISKAFYGALKGAPDYYTFTLKEPLNFYVNILVPDITNYNAIRFNVEVYEKVSNKIRILLFLDGGKGKWERYWERFGKDWYVKGPEAHVALTTNTVYFIRVFNSDNRGRYVLATGDMETFPVDEIIKAIFNVPALKMDFFGIP